MWILPEVDILATARRKYGVDWILNFRVENGGKLMKMMGYENSEIVDGFVDLSFFYGMCCTPDEDFHVAAFSVSKFKDHNIRMTGRGYYLEKEDICPQFKGNACQCSQAGCTYNVVTRNCRKMISKL